MYAIWRSTRGKTSAAVIFSRYPTGELIRSILKSRHERARGRQSTLSGKSLSERKSWAGSTTSMLWSLMRKMTPSAFGDYPTPRVENTQSNRLGESTRTLGKRKVKKLLYGESTLNALNRSSFGPNPWNCRREKLYTDRCRDAVIERVQVIDQWGQEEPV